MCVDADASRTPWERVAVGGTHQDKDRVSEDEGGAMTN
jgi:hypothetical protein